MADHKWAFDRGINLCYSPDGENTDLVCFHDIIKRMTNHQRSSVKSEVNFLANLNSAEPASRAQQPTIENAHKKTLTRQLADDITQIYKSNLKSMQNVLNRFIEDEELRAHVSQLPETSEVRVLI